MLRHVVIFEWKPDTTAQQVQHLAAGLAALPTAIDTIRRYQFGGDLGLRDGNGHFALVADFDDIDDWRAYVEHPVHQRLVTERIVPIAGRRVAVQYTVAGPGDG